MGDFSILAIRIKELRTSLNMTQKEFAAFVGCTAATLSAYENGSKSPSLEIIKGIAEKCHMSIDWLCGLTEQKEIEFKMNTYSDLFYYLLSLENKTNICFNVATYIGGYDEPITMHTQSIWFDNIQICNFMEEWEKMKSLHDSGTIDDDVYALWKEKVLKKDENANKCLDGSINIDAIGEIGELPFN